MAVSPTVRINVSGARGASFGDVARQTGSYGVAPSDNDAAVLNKFADFAISENPGFKGDKGDPGSPGEGYASRTALATAGSTATDLDDAYLTEPGREGKFVFSDADLSDEVTADPGQGIYVAPASDTTGASGAWVRQFTGPIVPEWFGAVGDEATNDTTALSRARAQAASRGPEASLFLSRSYLATAFDNPEGVRTEGPGKIVKSITGGVQQLSSYADVPGRIVYGKEYLFRVFQRAALGQSGSSGQIGCFLYGDSTVAGGYMSMSTVDLLKRLFQVRGIGNISITNRGVAGTTVADMNAVPDLGPTTDLAIIKYGINDAGNPEGTRLSTFQATLDSKIAAMRADTDGGVGNLAIVLVGPNSTSDTPNGRDERWYEQLRGIYVNIARKYQCCYIDTYAAFRDSRGGAGLWLDDPFADGRGIHPRDSLGLQLWSLVVNTIISRDEASWFGTANVLNLASNVYAPTNAATPDQWPIGIVHARATTGNGFPIDGFIVSHRHPESGVVQFLYPYGANDNRVLTRTANISGGAFNPWTGAPTGLTLSNSWTAVSGSTPSAYRDAAGTVHVRGRIEGGTVTAGTKIATLPAGMAPAEHEFRVVPSNGGSVTLKAQTNGDLVLQTTGDATWTSINMSYLAA